MPRKYKCKQKDCEEQYHRKEHSVCPVCGTPPVVKQPKPRKMEMPMAVDLEKEPSRVEQIRSVAYDANVKIWDDEKRIELRFLANQFIHSWVWCPNCNRKLFESHGTFGSFTHRCGKCSYDITLIFE